MPHPRLPLVLLLLAAGCGPSVPGVAKLVPVAGRVTVDGAPLTTGSLVFKPDAARGNTCPHEPVGKLDADGRYRLVTARQPVLLSQRRRPFLGAADRPRRPGRPGRRRDQLQGRQRRQLG